MKDSSTRRTLRRRLARAGAVALVLAVAGWLATGWPLDHGSLSHARAEVADSSGAGVVVEHVTLTTGRGLGLDCMLRRPAPGAAGRRFPAALVSGGIETGRRAALLVNPAYGGIVLSCDYSWRDPSRLSLPALLLRLPAVRARIIATPQALAVAAHYLANRPDVDPARLGAIGASLGVPGVVAWASGDPRPRAVALLFGGGNMRLVWDSRLEEEITWIPLRRVTAAALAFLLRPLEPTRWVGLIAPRPLLLVNGADDEWIPRRSVEALYQAAGEPKRVVWVGGRHLRPDDAALLSALNDSTTRWLETVMPERPEGSGPP
ncbi:MAG: alpha/beta hydrolase [Gemmatimonadales bacterium]|nr:alpha/beta hydrolase [Gemmatimonadales bacterium]